jgi:DNA-binding HxlR family transcriptional regulator
MDSTYGQFCPVAMAAEIVCSRWTALVIRELLCGSTRFNDIRRGVPRMSPTLLSKRLKELEQAGIVRLEPTSQPGTFDYRLTEAGEDLRGVIMTLGFWGQRWVEKELSLRNLDPSLLMWDMRRHLDPKPLPKARCTIHFLYPDLPENRRYWWLVVDRGNVDLCNSDPGFEVDLYVTGQLEAMTSIWMGLSDMKTEVKAGRLELSGNPAVARSMQAWLGLSPFATERNRRAAA